MKYIAMLSGGKDSTVMCDLLLKNDYPVDYILFNDTLDEYEDMYKYIYKLDCYFKERYGIGITKTRPSKTYDEYIYHKKVKGDLKGMISGLPNPTQGFCEWRGISKRDALAKFVKDIGDYKVYLGFTIDETDRMKDEENELYPLITDFKMSERDCQEYLINQDMENPVYRNFTRTGCVKCQFKSERDWFNTWKLYPEEWNKLKEYELNLSKLDNVVSKNIFSNFRTCLDMEKIFKKSDKQGSLFDFSDEPLKDCFCKI